ncbi:HlyD family secretion protein [Microvirga terricola]|uniref:HlyD family secretion protein n=1 Tax=Microvirga terricola TaxID=2719797 RepID=A0ABX0VGD3_9HYPH|nr:HlyD family secretion protein [Microvirga terricola]NIX77097.1 HlyD family secretion protein [Microvirga terricola]
MAYREEFAKAEERGPAVEGKVSDLPPEAPAAKVEAEAPQAPAMKPKGKLGKRPVIMAVLAAALAFGGYEGFHWWTVGRFMVSTDDAYVQADITILSAKVSGYVSSLAVTNNQSVKVGDLIAKIDDGDYRLALQSAKDKLATQASTITRIGRQIEAGKASVVQAQAQIAAAQADSERAEADYSRQLQLSQANYASKATFDAAKAARDRSDANVKSAEAALTAAQANVAVLSAQQVEAQRVAAELQTSVDKAQRDLSFTEIRAPLDGVIGNKAVEVGTYVQPGARLAALVPLANVHVDANFKETQLKRLEPGQKVHIEVDAYPNKDIVGTVESVSPAAGAVFSLLPPENATGNFTKIVQRVPVRVTVNPDIARQGLLRPGMSVVVSVDTRGDEPSKTASLKGTLKE